MQKKTLPIDGFLKLPFIGKNYILPPLIVSLHVGKKGNFFVYQGGG